MLSDILGQPIRLRLSASALRTIEKNGGLDAYLLGTCAAGATVTVSGADHPGIVNEVTDLLADYGEQATYAMTGLRW